MVLANYITKDLNTEKITPDPVMADPELFLRVWLIHEKLACNVGNVM